MRDHVVNWVAAKEAPMGTVGLKAGMAATGLLAAVLAIWTVVERNGRSHAESSATTLQDQLDAQGRELNRAANENRETAAKLAKAQQDIKDLSEQMKTQMVAHQTENLRMLEEKGDLSRQVEDLALKLVRADQRNKNLAEDLGRTLDGSRKLEESLSAERKTAAQTQEALDAELRESRSAAEKARRDAKQTAEALQKSQKDTQNIAKDLQRTADAANQAEQANDQLARDLDKVARDRDQANWTIQQFQAALNNALVTLRTRDFEIAGLRRELTKAQQSNQQLTQQVASLNAEVARLRKLLPPGTP